MCMHVSSGTYVCMYMCMFLCVCMFGCTCVYNVSMDVSVVVCMQGSWHVPVYMCVDIQGTWGRALGIKDPSAGFDLITWQRRVYACTDMPDSLL